MTGPVLVVEMAHADGRSSLRFEGVGSVASCQRQADLLQAAKRRGIVSRFDIRDAAGISVATLDLRRVLSARVEQRPLPHLDSHDAKSIASGG